MIKIYKVAKEDLQGKKLIIPEGLNPPQIRSMVNSENKQADGEYTFNNIEINKIVDWISEHDTLYSDFRSKFNTLNSTEDAASGSIGGLSGVGAPLTSSGAVSTISSPVLRKRGKRISKEGVFSSASVTCPKCGCSVLYKELDYDPDDPSEVLGCINCFDEETGQCMATLSEESLSDRQVSPQKNRKMPIVGSDTITGATEANMDEIPEENKGGDCFVQALNTFQENLSQSPKLVHAVITGQGPIEGIKYVHAWVEIGDMVIDATIPLFASGFPREAYYRLARIDEDLVYKYEKDQVWKNLNKFKTYGPWEDILWKY